ncbi:MAG: hypothetical protein WEA76_07170 [Acidimicrobiia bacterium]
MVSPISEAWPAHGPATSVSVQTASHRPGTLGVTQERLGLVREHHGLAGERGPACQLTGKHQRRDQETGNRHVVPPPRGLGGWLDQSLINQRWIVQTRKGPVLGITGIKTVHIMSVEARGKVFKREDIFIVLVTPDPHS